MQKVDATTFLTAAVLVETCELVPHEQIKWTGQMVALDLMNAERMLPEWVMKQCHFTVLTQPKRSTAISVKAVSPTHEVSQCHCIENCLKVVVLILDVDATNVFIS